MIAMAASTFVLIFCVGTQVRQRTDISKINWIRPGNLKSKLISRLKDRDHVIMFQRKSLQSHNTNSHHFRRKTKKLFSYPDTKFSTGNGFRF
jgi:hypothetical protein